MEGGNILHESVQLPFSWYVGLLLAHTFPPFFCFILIHFTSFPFPLTLKAHSFIGLSFLMNLDLDICQ